MLTRYSEWTAWLHTPIAERVQACDCRRTLEHVRNRRIVISELPEKMRRMTFASFLDAREDLDKNQRAELNGIKVMVQSYAYARLETPWLVLYGTKGWGKTHLAVAVVNTRIEEPEAGPIPKFVSVPGLLNNLRQGFDDNSYADRLQSYFDAPMLILDDLGTENATSWAIEQLFMIVDFRYGREKATVITTNTNVDQMEPRIRDRILDRGTGLCTALGTTLPSYRQREVTW